LAPLTERGFWGEDDALRLGHLDEALDETLPRCIPRLWRKGEVAPEVDTRPRHAKFNLAWVEKQQWCCPTHQQIGVRREANMHPLEPCRSGKPLRCGQQAHVPTMQPIKNPKGEDRTGSTLH
jgi:hypothetical protein